MWKKVTYSIPFSLLSSSYNPYFSLPIILITILVAKTNDLILRRMVQATGVLNKISGIILVIVGLYLTVISFLISEF